jgi:sulfate permease, SulP family
MIMVSIGTFNWDSVRKLREHPPSSSDRDAGHRGRHRGHARPGQGRVRRRAAVGHSSSRTRSGACCAWTAASAATGRTRTYGVVGQVFFASAETLHRRLRLQGGGRARAHRRQPAHFWDITAVSALDKVVLKFKREGTEVEVIGLNEASATMVDRFAVHDKPGAVEQLMH